jgi:predicted kinase
MPTMHIVRGVPGSGKTTFAKKLWSWNVGDYFWEADMFMVDVDGNYVFDGSRLKECHANCFAAVSRDVSERRDVIVSNTFIRKWEMENYLELAKANGYRVMVWRMMNRFDNVHGVPVDRVETMLTNMEDVEGEYKVCN